MERLGGLIFNAIESLRNNKKHPNEDIIHATINKDLTLEERFKRMISCFIRQRKAFK